MCDSPPFQITQWFLGLGFNQRLQVRDDPTEFKTPLFAGGLANASSRGRRYLMRDMSRGLHGQLSVLEKHHL